MPTIDIPSAFRPLFKPHRYKASWGGRGSTKSHSFVAAQAILAAQKPLRIMAAREIQKSIEDSTKRLWEDKIKALGLEGHYHVLKSEIRGYNGTLIRFAGLRTNPDAIKSAEGFDILDIEEANTVSQESLDLAIPTFRKPGSEIWARWNPRDATDPIDKMFRGEKGPPPGAALMPVSWRDNRWLSDELRAEIEHARRTDPEKYAHVWEGAYRTMSEARVFRNWRVEEFETPPDAEFYFGADWGFSVDPTVLVRCFIIGRTLYVDAEAYAVGCAIDKTPDLFDTVAGAREWVIRADSARPETIDYMKRNGYPRIQAARKGAGSVEEGVEFLKSYDIVVHPRARHVIEELTFYSWKVDKLTGDIQPVLADKDNHTIDALRYAVEGVRRNKGVHVW